MRRVVVVVVVVGGTAASVGKDETDENGVVVELM